MYVLCGPVASWRPVAGGGWLEGGTDIRPELKPRTKQTL